MTMKKLVRSSAMALAAVFLTISLSSVARARARTIHLGARTNHPGARTNRLRARTIHLNAGQSFTLEFKHPISTVRIVNPKVADVSVDAKNPKKIEVVALKKGSTKVVVTVRVGARHHKHGKKGKRYRRQRIRFLIDVR